MIHKGRGLKPEPCPAEMGLPNGAMCNSGDTDNRKECATAECAMNNGTGSKHDWRCEDSYYSCLTACMGATNTAELSWGGAALFVGENSGLISQGAGKMCGAASAGYVGLSTAACAFSCRSSNPNFACGY